MIKGNAQASDRVGSQRQRANRVDFGRVWVFHKVHLACRRSITAGKERPLTTSHVQNLAAGAGSALTLSFRAASLKLH